MRAADWPYQRPVLMSTFVFFVSCIAFISTRETWLLIIPFAWILVPYIFTYAITHSQQLFWLLFITLPLSTEYNITARLGIDFPDELLLLLLTGITIVKMLHQPRWFPVKPLYHPLFLVLALQITWMGITCLFSMEPLLSCKYLLAKSWFIIPFVLLPQVLLHTRSRIEKMARCILLSMLMAVVFILVRHSFHGFSFESIRFVMAPFFRNHVNYSSMLVCLLPAAWCMWKLTPAGKPWKQLVLWGMLVGLTALLFAYSRGAWMALLAGLITPWIIRKKMMSAFLILIVMVVVITTMWLVNDRTYMRFAPDHDHTVFHTDFEAHLLATVNMKDVSTAERFYRWIAGVRMVAGKPVTGFGPNSFYLHYRPYTVNRFATWVSDNPEHSTVHNYFLLVAVEQGLPGLALFCILYAGMLLHAQKLYHRLQSRFYRTIALTIGIILVMIGVINCMSDMIETDKIGSLFWLCLGIIILLTGKSQEEKRLLAV